MSLGDGVRSSQGPRSPDGWGMSSTSSPGSAVSSVTSLSPTISLFVDLPCSCDGQRTRGYILRDRRACSRPRAVPDGHGRDEHSLATGVDVAADDRPLLLTEALGTVVRGDRARPDVGSVADLGVAD